MTIYDSQGNSHIASTYFVTRNTATPNTWDAYLFIDGKPFNVDGTLATIPLVPPGNQTAVRLDFNTAGKLSGTSPAAPITYPNISSADIDPNLTVDDLNLTFSFTGTTQYSSVFSVNNLAQDGLPAGNLTGISVSDDGILFANFSNGGTQPLGKIALARFANPQGLTKLGDTTWGQTSSSGERVNGEPGKGSFGLIQSGAVEASNVDLSEQLVHLIIGQQAYQANAQTISTENTITQTILNIR
jgi:flagellar hook protein FlgE